MPGGYGVIWRGQHLGGFFLAISFLHPHPYPRKIFFDTLPHTYLYSRLRHNTALKEDGVYSLGIDPGSSGGMVLLDRFADGTMEVVSQTPFKKAGMDEVYDLLMDTDLRTVTIEKVHATPQMGVTSSFSFGKHFGGLMAAITIAQSERTREFELNEISPMKWQRDLGLLSRGRTIGKGDTTKKNRNKERVCSLFPEDKWTHATADAGLLAYWGYGSF